MMTSVVVNRGNVVSRKNTLYHVNSTSVAVASVAVVMMSILMPSVSMTNRCYDVISDDISGGEISKWW